MKFYYSIFLVLLMLSAAEVFGHIPRRLKTMIEIAVLAVMILISGIRSGPLGDFENYEALFNNTNIRQNIWQLLKDPVMANTEILYNLLNYTVKYAGGSFRTFIVLEAVIVNVLFYVFCKTTVFHDTGLKKDYTLTVFLTMWGLRLFQIYIVRQTIAIAICWSSIRYIRKRRFIKFALCILAAVMFHRSAAVFIAAYWIYWVNSKNRMKRIEYFTAVIIGSVGFIIFIRPLSEYLPGMTGYKVRMYLDTGLSGYGSGFNLLFIFMKTFANIGVILFIILFLFRRMKDDDFFLGLSNLYGLGAAVVFATSFTANQLSRLAQPFTMISIFIFPYLFCRAGRKNKVILYLVFTFYLGMRLYLNIHESVVMLQGYPNILT